MCGGASGPVGSHEAEEEVIEADLSVMRSWNLLQGVDETTAGV